MSLVRVSPSIIGTTVATIIATAYVAIYDDSHLQLWTPILRFVILGGPVVVLIAHSITAYIRETRDGFDEEASRISKAEYSLRVIAQLLLGLSLAALTEDLRLYIALFICFVILTTYWSVFTRHFSIRISWPDLANCIACIVYAYTAFRMYQIAHDFERTYPVFALDHDSFVIHRDSVRGAMMDYVGGVFFSVGAITVVNLFALGSGLSNLWPPRVTVQNG